MSAFHPSCRRCSQLDSRDHSELHTIPAAHERVIHRTLAWLDSSMNPSVRDLFEWCDYSRRQTERVVQNYFGFAPRALARRFRAARTIDLLSQQYLSGEDEAEIASAFFDQSHMIREIWRFCGCTPSRLRKLNAPMLKRICHSHNLECVGSYRRGELNIAQYGPIPNRP